MIYRCYLDGCYVLLLLFTVATLMGAMCYFFCLQIELLNNEVNLLITHYAFEVIFYPSKQ